MIHSYNNLIYSHEVIRSNILKIKFCDRIRAVLTNSFHSLSFTYERFKQLSLFQVNDCITIKVLIAKDLGCRIVILEQLNAI